MATDASRRIVCLQRGLGGDSRVVCASLAPHREHLSRLRISDRQPAAARDSIEIGQGERRQFWRDVAQTKGQQIASMAANGIDVDFGSAARVQDNTQLLANEDADNLYRNIHSRTQGHVVNASNFIERGKAERVKGKAKLIGSLFEGAGTLMGAATQMSKLKPIPRPTAPQRA